MLKPQQDSMADFDSSIRLPLELSRALKALLVHTTTHCGAPPVDYVVRVFAATRDFGTLSRLKPRRSCCPFIFAFIL
jgi:hypothetical protein